MKNSSNDSGSLKETILNVRSFGSGSVIEGHSDHAASKEAMNT